MSILPTKLSVKNLVRGFSLIEMVGALSIMTILATIVMENVLESLKRKAREIETQNLANIADALQASILRTKTIPGANNWAATVADELVTPKSKVLTNTAMNQRLFLVDPDCRIGINNSLTPPYRQTNGGSIQPISPRVLIISSMADPLPAVSNTTANFSNLWNTLPYTIPTLWASTWDGPADDLKFQRVNLSPLFNRVVLTDVDSANNGVYSVETTNTVDPLTTVPAGTPVQEMWLLNGSVVNFFDTTSNLIARERITGDASYTFEFGQWGRYVRFGTNTTGAFGTMADQFLATTNSNSRRYPTQQWIVDAMTGVLQNFGQWSLDRFTNYAPRIPAWELTSPATNSLITYTKDLYIYKY